ncbi:MAG: hypothetical protein HRU43_02850 [Simkaniaceae bacterium]|nr:hypothetical protein [Simkaniaceae bacterium]
MDRFEVTIGDPKTAAKVAGLAIMAFWVIAIPGDSIGGNALQLVGKAMDIGPAIGQAISFIAHSLKDGIVFVVTKLLEFLAWAPMTLIQAVLKIIHVLWEAAGLAIGAGIAAALLMAVYVGWRGLQAFHRVEAFLNPPIAEPQVVPDQANGAEPFVPPPYPPGAFNIHHVRYFVEVGQHRAGQALKQGAEALRNARAYIQTHPEAKAAVYVSLAAYTVAVGAIGLMIIAGVVKSTAYFVGGCLNLLYTGTKGTVQMIGNCCGALVEIAYNIAGMFGNVMKSGYGVLKDGANLAANGGKAIGNSIQVIVGKAYNANMSQEMA